MGWTAYLGGARHDVSAVESLNPDPRPQWTTDVGRAVRGSPALGETVVAVGLAERQVVLLDRASGEPIWRHRVEGTVLSGPLLAGDRLYVATEEAPDGAVYALALRDGHRLWKRRAGSVAAPLALDGAALYAATERGLVLRLDPEKGGVVWRRTLAGAVRAGPVPTPEGLVVATTSDTLFLLDPETGGVRARSATPGAVVGTPAVSGSHLFLATTAGHVLAVGLPALAVRWDRDVGDVVFGAPALRGDTVFALTRGGALWVVPTEAPDAARMFALNIAAVAGPTPTASGVLVASVSGEVLLVDTGSGEIRWRARVDGPVEQPPLVHDRQLVVVDGRGTIHTYR
jgi:outer membrane protein assembly factor BamB